MRHAVSDQNVKKTTAHKCLNVNEFMHLNGFIFVCTFKINVKFKIKLNYH